MTIMCPNIVSRKVGMGLSTQEYDLDISNHVFHLEKKDIFLLGCSDVTAILLCHRYNVEHFLSSSLDLML